MKNNVILERWAGTLQRRGGDAAILGRDGSIERTFADIEAEAGVWAERLACFAEKGAGGVVGMQVGNRAHWPALVLGALRVGVIALPLGRHMAVEEREAALRVCGARGLVREEFEPETREGTAEKPELLEGVDFLKLTSGTTAEPRAIRFTAEQLVADCDHICETMGIGDADLNFGVIPFSHSYGFSNLVTPLICRGVPLVASEDRMPRAMLADLGRTQATVFPGMPVFYEKLTGLAEAMTGIRFGDAREMLALRLCISAGAPLTTRVGEGFTRKFGMRVHTFYGSSECGGIGYDREEEGGYEEGFVGQAMDGVEVLESNEGRISVRSAAVGVGYYPVEEPEVLGEGRFVPGDLVRMGERGMYLEGRATDVINIAGRKLNPAEIEGRLAECPGVRQVVIFGVPSALRGEEAVACVSGSVTAEELIRFARGVLSDWQAPKDVWLVPEVPVSERGKVSRRELGKLYAERSGEG